VTGTVNLSTHITDVVAALEAEQAAISPTAAVMLALSAKPACTLRYMSRVKVSVYDGAFMPSGY
jgi:hypothetical protein